MNVMKSFYSILVAFVLSSQITSSQTLDVHVKDIKSAKGQICIAIFADAAGFQSEKTIWETKYAKKLVTNGNLDLTIPLRAGKYGLSVLDDENMSGKMEYNLFGIPLEGFGFSNYYHRGFCKPSFDDFSFVVEKDEVVCVTVYMKYF
ncbi:MAG TPA: DUF2141 domain-containing protein [Paludibacter sp.]